MKIVIILWNLLLLLIVIAGLVLVLPKVYDQAHGQFVGPHGDASMWPVTFDGFLTVASFLACAAALSWLINRKLSKMGRILIVVVSMLLISAWIGRAVIYGYYSDAMRFNFEGCEMLAFAIVSFCVAAIFGRGPLSSIGHLVRTIRSKRQSYGNERSQTS